MEIQGKFGGCVKNIPSTQTLYLALRSRLPADDLGCKRVLRGLFEVDVEMENREVRGVLGVRRQRRSSAGRSAKAQAPKEALAMRRRRSAV